VSRDARRTWTTGDGRPDEAGFTLVEVLVSVALVAATMAALAVFFGASTSAARHHGDLQRATQFAVAAVERVAQADGPAILAGRTQAAVTSQPQVPGVAGYLTGQQMVLVWADRNAPATTPLLPTTPQPVTVGGTATKFTRSWYVGKCWQPVGGGRCTVVPPGQRAASVPFYRVVVAVTWPDATCRTGPCSYVTSTLVVAETQDPLFGG
jgi:prepilin-type N-terminal cleavage/methylation domain-containing protein